MPLGDTGSSPHLRGTQTDRLPGARRDRFIPAPAGNTATATGKGKAAPVHPRTCGEHACQGGTSSRKTGSSPHLRGTHRKPHYDIFPSRFIPAPAGNTATMPPCSTSCAVHPRTCGEHQRPVDDRTHVPGSSPHLRGTRVTPPSFRRKPWFIPAPAGNTQLLSW